MNTTRYRIGFNELIEAKSRAEALALAKKLMFSENSYTIREANQAVVSARDVFLAIQKHIRDWHKEYLLLASFNTRQELMAVDVVSIGTLNTSLVHPREVFSCAIKHRAASVILVHNHPSGDLSPSEEDIAVTGRIAQAGKLLGILVTDHVVVSNTEYYSLLEHGQVNAFSAEHTAYELCTT
jgi:DNA repair protein RadC